MSKKGKHLTEDDRYEIESALKEGQSFKQIACSLEKDPSTISKEVRTHIVFEKRSVYGRNFNNCIHRRKCIEDRSCSVCTSEKKRCSLCGKCIEVCDKYEPESCPKLEVPPYVCNHCPNDRKCTLERHYYKARYAHREYLETLSESRSGFSITEDELQSLNRVLSPLIQKGQSIHNICQNHTDEIHYSEKTLYNFMDAGLLDARNLDLPRKVRFRARKKKSTEFKVDKRCRQNRTHLDFQKFCEEHPDMPVTEMDTVEGVKGKAVLLTLFFRQQRLQLAFYRESNTSKSVTDIFHHLYEELGPETYKRIFQIILTDNGSEFSDPEAIEFDANGNRLSYVFYCDPQASFQKGGCENNHEMIRRIIPKGVDITQYSPDQINLMMSHINSYAREKLGGKTPYDLFEFTYGQNVLDIFGLHRILPDDVVLKPELLR